MNKKQILKEGDFVHILYDDAIGYIERIHGWQPLYDIRGLDKSKYPNQYASEILLMESIVDKLLELERRALHEQPTDS